MTEREVYDITIIGGGPVGLFAAFCAGMRSMSTKIIDSLPELGGQLSTLYPEKYVYDMPGFPCILARDLVQRMVEQAMRFHPTVCLDEEALDLRQVGGVLANHHRQDGARYPHGADCSGSRCVPPSQITAAGYRRV
ncbi:MAG: hypothetical protein KatS3mg022_2346 [Armatimonadota bacterium]|nr:MAG: hypothetical protein KatS3mg022_2346 [Armatimonadota bacterium]